MDTHLNTSLKAKNQLIQLGFDDSDFSEATQDDVEVGYTLGEYLLISEDSCKSAIELLDEINFWKENEENYINFMI